MSHRISPVNQSANNFFHNTQNYLLFTCMECHHWSNAASRKGTAQIAILLYHKYLRSHSSCRNRADCTRHTAAGNQYIVFFFITKPAHLFPFSFISMPVPPSMIILFDSYFHNSRFFVQYDEFNFQEPILL